MDYKKLTKRAPTNAMKTAFVKTAGMLLRDSQSPDIGLGQLFADVQKSGLYDDGKTFVDLVPSRRVRAIRNEYAIAKKDPNFNLQEFIKRHFYEFSPHKNRDPFVADPNRDVREHIRALWDELERRNRKTRGSLLALPHPYIVPGGRFNEQFYWDTYFIMLGLAADDRWDSIDGMMKNYMYMLRKWGFIPTANRSYFLTRSQPPMYALMVQLLATKKGKTRTYAEQLPYLLREYQFWMKGRRKLARTEHHSYLRTVRLSSKVYLNRYYDNAMTPRPESLIEDEHTAITSDRPEKDRIYLHLRAAAESGWDFSSRWFTDPKDIATIHTADIVPVDLNALMYILESTIADAYRQIKNPLLARKFDLLAIKRAAAIDEYCWSTEHNFYVDYNFHHEEKNSHLTLAAVFPLFAGIASKEQADHVAQRLKNDFLKPGGLVTTVVQNGQQWDSPNGWAPLQWIAIQGLRNYGHDELANEIKERWIAVNQSVYTTHYKLIEKYAVDGESGLGGGGEYPLQDGFGWTNGVLAALLDEELPS